MEITVTDKATEQLLGSGLDEQNFLRLGVRQGGCAGMSYDAFIDDVLTEADTVIYQQDKLRIVGAQEFLHLIDGLTIDFSDDLVQPGFILTNPNSQKSCGCGASFKAREEDTITPCGGNC
ncbi:MAG: iron-sulfur cluster assembly accessory protein [Kiritimatiellaceae bacterium]|nr:iron-sulfur cluster assembly accessory protein [Kiritimatiellaceae bacterium]